MSIIYNNKVIAGKYKEQIINKADTLNDGIIKIATQQEIDSGIDNTTAVTPLYLSQKQDKLIAGDNIIIDANLIECDIYPDKQTIIQNNDGTFTNIGQLTKSGTIKIDWEGTEDEYTQAMLDGIIQPDWYCYITDDEAIVDYGDVANQSLSNLKPEGENKLNNLVINKANVNLDNLGVEGESKLNNLVADKATIDLDNLSEEGIKIIKNNSGTSLQMFDTILKDHVLTYEESKGLALQGTYVYKEAVAGSRYGYPDFYAKCLEEYNECNPEDISWTQPVLTSDGVMGGSSFAVRGDTILTGQAGIYIYGDAYYAFDGNANTCWHGTQNAFTGGITFYSPEYIKVTNLTITNWTYPSGNNGNTGIGSGRILASQDDKNWVELKTFSNSVTQAGASWDIDLSNNSLGYKYYKIEAHSSTYGYPIIGDINITATKVTFHHTNGHIFYDISQKDIVDELFNSTGMAWMYGIDTENERVFLPRNNWFEQVGGIDEVGQSVEAGLPNITGSSSMLRGAEYQGAGSGAIYVTTGTSKAYSTVEVSSPIINFDASRSSAIYGNSDTVQPNAVKKLLYICVGNTESQSTITDVVDVTTTENDTLPLGYHFYQAGAQPSVSYIKSEGQWNDGIIYTTFYNEFVNKIGQDFASGKVVEYTEDYTDYDLVINQDDMTFRLPLLDGSESLIDASQIESIIGVPFTAKYNGFIFIATQSSTSQYLVWDIDDNPVAGTKHPDGGTYTANFPIKKGQILTCSATIETLKEAIIFKYVGNGSLYFKVANAVTNLELLNAGEVLEAVADISANVIPNNSSLIAGYGMPSDKKVTYTNFANGTNFVAPANGWFNAKITTNSAGDGWASLNNLTTDMQNHAYWRTNGGSSQTIIPAKKGDEVRVTYGGCTIGLLFIYAEGSKGDS